MTNFDFSNAMVDLHLTKFFSCQENCVNLLKSMDYVDPRGRINISEYQKIYWNKKILPKKGFQEEQKIYNMTLFQYTWCPKKTPVQEKLITSLTGILWDTWLKLT